MFLFTSTREIRLLIETITLLLHRYYSFVDSDKFRAPQLGFRIKHAIAVEPLKNIEGRRIGVINRVQNLVMQQP